MKPSSSSPPTFGVAARRHLKDGLHLHGVGSHVTADHLAGLSAECALKAVLTGFLAVPLSQKGIPTLPSGNNVGHLPGIWSQVGAYIGGRTGARLTGLLAASNPFDTWDIADRYSDGALISAAVSRAHLDAAFAIVEIHDLAVVSGAVP